MKYSSNVLNYEQEFKIEQRNDLSDYIDIFNDIIQKGGPDPSDYEFLIQSCNVLINSELTQDYEYKLYEKIQPILNLDSMIGFSFLKPNGYAGDYELIDRIYQEWKSPRDTAYHKWDDFYHALDAAKAVRNRKKYLINLLSNLDSKTEPAQVLNLGSGPCSDLYYFFQKHPMKKIHFDCLDMDKNAINFSSAVCDNYTESITFINKNAFRYKTDRRYDLIWSAGLFDYFNDKLFVRLLNRMYQFLSESGKLVIGNFSDKNPSRGVMEIFGQWYLHHRSKEELKLLAIEAGISKQKIKISSEETGVNLFLLISK